MASATKKLCPPVPVRPQVAGVSLELSVEEAVALRHVLGKVGGDGQARKATDKIMYALSDAGIGLGGGGYLKTPNEYRGISFDANTDDDFEYKVKNTKAGN